MSKAAGTFTITPIKNETRVHTGVSRTVKARVEAISRATKVPQATIYNSLLVKALATDWAKTATARK